MDLSDVFEFGQGYVALSRVRRLSGLYLLGWNERAFHVHPEILAKDKTFRLDSRDAETALVNISSAEMQKRQKNFIAICDGKIIPEDHAGLQKTSGVPPIARLLLNKKFIPEIPIQSRQSGFEKTRKIYPNAYLSWDKAQDERLQELFEAN